MRPSYFLRSVNTPALDIDILDKEAAEATSHRHNLLDISTPTTTCH